MRKIAVLFCMLVVGAVGATSAFGASVHLKGGANAEPTFIDQGLYLQAVGEIAGLGEGDVIVALSATGNPTADCVNPGTGEHRPPGQQPAEVTLTGTQEIPASELKNGNTPFNVRTTAPVSPVAGAPGCPNSQWIENITDVAFTSAVITVKQGGVTVLTVSCTFSPPTSDGTVPGSQVSCTSS